MSISISSPTNGASVSSNTQTVTITGQSIQSVDGVALPAQTFTENWDISTLQPGNISRVIKNSAGESVTLTLKKLAAESTEGTTLTGPSGQIVDAQGNVWTLFADPTNGNVVYENGTKPALGYTMNVAALAYYGHKVYQTNGTGWWVWDGSTPWAAAADPRPAITQVKFWGVNGHLTWPQQYQNNSAQVSKLADLNMTTYRNGYALGDLQKFKDFISVAKGKGVGVYPVLLAPMGYADEQAAYNAGYALGVEVAGLAGMVVAYDITNELDGWCILGGQYNGDLPSHYDNTKFTLVRGIVRGAMDGIRSIDQKTPIVGPSGTWLHTGLLDMLVNGTQPDGTTGHPKCVFDVIAWHWYSDMGDMEKAGWINMNVLAKLASFGKPIWITEYGVRPSYGTEDAMAAYLTGPLSMGKWASVAAKYGITHTAMYDLFDDGNLGSDGNYGLVLSDGVTNKGRYPSVKTYVAANPK